MIRKLFRDKSGVSMLVYGFMITAITLMLILLQFNTMLLLNERSKIDNIGDEAVTKAAWDIYEVAKEELETTGVISNKPEYISAIEDSVRNVFSTYSKNVTSLAVTIDGYHLTIEGIVSENRYKSPDYNNPISTPVEIPFKNTAIIKGVTKK
ncbi:hypothetical protein [Mahella australiensis]|uniref:Uncharacterized protein n=1 Tax=Mahella australiensis (strain DSM 15567 / CIP 107919 / 50-1 BON) TaxID=697281 RepID=F3ZWT7_MAHA5|nr:hypothetical protein [Mahella australiensis]AEE97559.1 hypothetical protein Mahau_2395 [Mahella australiensis 50-1 BON]